MVAWGELLARSLPAALALPVPGAFLRLGGLRRDSLGSTRLRRQQAEPRMPEAGDARESRSRTDPNIDAVVPESDVLRLPARLHHFQEAVDRPAEAVEDVAARGVLGVGLRDRDRKVEERSADEGPDREVQHVLPEAEVEIGLELAKERHEAVAIDPQADEGVDVEVRVAGVLDLDLEPKPHDDSLWSDVDERSHAVRDLRTLGHDADDDVAQRGLDVGLGNEQQDAGVDVDLHGQLSHLGAQSDGVGREREAARLHGTDDPGAGLRDDPAVELESHGLRSIHAPAQLRLAERADARWRRRERHHLHLLKRLQPLLKDVLVRRHGQTPSNPPGPSDLPAARPYDNRRAMTRRDAPRPRDEKNPGRCRSPPVGST